MNVVGIVCEYNPFHLGHLYQIGEARRHCAADMVVAIMSGNFTQRGECAIVDKYHRTKMALAAGVDLVLELPSIYATAASGYFAQGAVLSLAASGVVNYISFGSECGDKATLMHTANILAAEPAEYRTLLKSLFTQGLSYPKAQARALHSLYGIDLLNNIKPNDLLGLNYLITIHRFHLPLDAIVVPRLGSHHGDENSDVFASSQSIRQRLAENIPIDNAVPDSTAGILKNAPKLYPTQLAPTQLALLRRAKLNELENLPDINSDLAHRLQKAAANELSLADVLAKAKNKSCTYSRLRRAMCHLLLGISKADYAEPAYLRVLGFSENGQTLLKSMKKQASLPIITTLSQSTSSLSPEAQKMLELDLAASNIYRAFSGEFTPHDEFRLFPVRY